MWQTDGSLLLAWEGSYCTNTDVTKYLLTSCLPSYISTWTDIPYTRMCPRGIHAFVWLTDDRYPSIHRWCADEGASGNNRLVNIIVHFLWLPIFAMTIGNFSDVNRIRDKQVWNSDKWCNQCPSHWTSIDFICGSYTECSTLSPMSAIHFNCVFFFFSKLCN